MKVFRDLEYWRNISYQERNNNLLLAETIKLIEQMKDGDIDIIECGIEIGYRVGCTMRSLGCLTTRRSRTRT